ncbi:hypothetical protein AB1285_25840 [Microbacterium sp. NRRL B-14842]|uniref:hypothetical protein n=1 Tax=Microbacterium sp. NRRL B-14842 TaxID=3162881 RepID=UPI003D2CBF73
MAEEMQRRAAGDIAVNLAATSLAANRWLYDGDEEAAAWIRRYVDGWRARADGGLLPDNVGPDGTVGSLHDGRWWGGHYGWAWPHGLHSVGMSALIGALNHALVTGDDAAPRPRAHDARHRARRGAHGQRRGVHLQSARRMDGPARCRRPPSRDCSSRTVTARTAGSTTVRCNSTSPCGSGGGRDGRLTGSGWRRRSPVSPTPPTSSRRSATRRRAGHEAGWFAYLSGDLPDYPVRALEMALGQVARRAAMMLADDRDPRRRAPALLAARETPS